MIETGTSRKGTSSEGPAQGRRGRSDRRRQSDTARYVRLVEKLMQCGLRYRQGEKPRQYSLHMGYLLCRRILKVHLRGLRLDHSPEDGATTAAQATPQFLAPPPSPSKSEGMGRHSLTRVYLPTYLARGKVSQTGTCASDAQQHRRVS